jgi:hypothetical protein
MGVLECDRKGCENIMCHLLSDKFGYICFDCYEDLVAFCVNAKNCDDDTINSFMHSPKQQKRPLDIEPSVRAALEKEFVRS